MKMIPYGKQSIIKEDINSVIDVLNSDFLTTGPSVKQFEDALCNYTGAKYAIACSNGTAALHLSCLALEIGKNGLGLTTPITFLASANCIEYCGGRTDFVDIDEDTLCLSPDKLEEYCKNKEVPKVVIPVSFAGIPADLPKIKALADKYGFSVIEDAAHAIGSVYTYNNNDVKCGSCTHSDMAIFSFHPVKTITTGEGGAILTNNADLAKRARLLRSHGMTKDVIDIDKKPWYYEMSELGWNYRITDLQCALGLSQLNRLDEFKAKRQKVVNAYNKAFKNNPKLIIPPWQKNTSPCQHLYPIRFVDGEDVRLEVYNKLLSSGIISQVHYIPVYWQPYYKNKYAYKKGKCSNAELYYSQCLSLPLFPELTFEQLDLITEIIVNQL